MIVYRQQIEAREAASLAFYACRSAESKGRVYPEAEDPHRTAFQRDRDRIIHTSAFRRLEYKTQVFVNYEGDYYRTRLTHTLEVAQIGRSIARALGANEDLVEAICLCHDLGHPPFGHAGEDALNHLMHDHGGYNHNLQTYRVVTKLEQRYPGWAGLNLTHELREGIAKHESKTDFSAREGFDPALRGTLEAQIADLSDGIAYNAHDLDDGLRSGLLSVEQVSALEMWRRAQESVGWDGAGFNDAIRYQMIRRIISLSINDVIMASGERLEQHKPDSVGALQRLPLNMAGPSPIFAQIHADLKAFLYGNLYSHFRVIRMQQKAMHTVRCLFHSFLDVPTQMPPEFQKQANEKGLPRAVTDYIAGMTDRYALEEYQRLYEPFVRP
jgi:dGTPase